MGQTSVFINTDLLELSHCIYATTVELNSCDGGCRAKNLACYYLALQENVCQATEG
jgi:hypothetical protein